MAVILFLWLRIYDIYIYIYIVIHRYCFVLSELFSVARHIGRSKPGSKPVQHYVTLRSHTARPTSAPRWLREFLRYYVVAAAASVCLHFIPFRLPECSILSKSFALCERWSKIPSPEWYDSEGTEKMQARNIVA